MKFLWATVLCLGECGRLQLKSHPFFLVHGDPSRRGRWGKAPFMKCLQGCPSLCSLRPWTDTVFLIVIAYLYKIIFTGP